MTAKPMKTLELQYPVIQFLITKDFQIFSNQSEGTFYAIYCFSLY